MAQTAPLGPKRFVHNWCIGDVQKMHAVQPGPVPLAPIHSKMCPHHDRIRDPRTVLQDQVNIGLVSAKPC